MAKAPPTLTQVRAKIDAVDDAILRLIDERSALARDVISAKQAAGEGDKLALRPARENQVLRRLIGSERKAANRQLIVRVWRELMGDSLYAQSPYQITTWSGRARGPKIAELARARFGYAPSIYNVDEPEQALAAVKTHGGVAVLAVVNDSAWWARMLVEPTLSIVATLPEVNQWGGPLAMAVAQVQPEPSGEGDETLWVTDSKMPTHELETLMAVNGVAMRYLTRANGLQLYALPGYYMADDARLAAAPGDITGIVGVVPTPFDM